LEEHVTREEALSLARTAARRAAVLADHAENTAHKDDPNRRHQVQQFAAAGAAWADVARAHAAIASATPEPTPDPTTDDETADA
jgi:hypothetical protein